VDSTEIRWDEGRGEVTLRNLPTKISDYDRNAIEAAVVLKESGELVELEVLMVGGDAAQKTLKEAVAMGADRGCMIEGGWDDPFDPLRTARVLARAVGELEEPDIIMCGLVSEDGYSGIVPPALAQLLDVPYLAPVVKLEVEPDQGVVEAVLDDSSVRRTVKVPTPCILGVDSPMNVPRLPTVLQVMKVKGDRIGSISLADLGLSAEAAELTPAAALAGCESGAVERKRVVIEGPPHESAVRLVESLKQEGVL
jgi:electron transfer flavoprotein beta subunit